MYNKINGTLPNSIFIISGSLFLSIFMYSCENPGSISSFDGEPLFQVLSSKQSGVNFANTLHETDTFNSLFYEYYYNGSGVAIGDLNNDGFSDIFFGANMTKSRIYLNKGQLNFEDITESSKIDTQGSWVTGVSMVDVNQDGWLDIYVCVGGNIIDDYTNLLFINDANEEELTFTERAKLVGLDDKGYSTQAGFFDYDRDGDLDMYLVTSSMNVPNKNSLRKRTGDGTMINTDRLYRNEGIDPVSKLPKFINVSQGAGIIWDGFGLGISISDINLDGWPDVYVTNDYITSDLLYVNQGDGTFKDMANEYFKHTSYSAMGVDISDFNNDGLVDVFALDMLPEDYYRKRTMAGNMREFERYMAEQKSGYAKQYTRNTLQLNNGKIDGKQSFSEIGQLSKVFETDWSWVPLFADFDNDGHKDLFIGNGIPYDLTNMDISAIWLTKMKERPDMSFEELYETLKVELDKKGNVKKPNVIFKNSSKLTFEDKTIAWGMSQPSYTTSAAFSDLDNDGDLDMILNNINDPAVIYKNTLIDNAMPDSVSHYLKVHLQGENKNKGGIGAKITLFLSNQIIFYEHYPVRGFQSMVDPEIHFGLGQNTHIDSLLIWWTNGKEQQLFEIKANQLIDVKCSDALIITKSQQNENLSETLFTEVSDKTNIRYTHQERDFIDFKIQPLIPHQYSKEGPGIAVGDVNGDMLDDFFIGGSTGYQGEIFIQNQNGSFRSSPLHNNPNYEDMGALFFDVDNDGDNDLYVVSGGTGLPPGNPFYGDRLFINNGKGDFTLEKNILPQNGICGSQVSAADYDKDGDLDLFICGRVSLENYPLPVKSFLFRNDSHGSKALKFTNVTTEVNDGLEKIGLVTSALWTDYNNDGWVDLILTGEWMPITIFKNEEGKLVNVTAVSGLENYTGWWNSLIAGDFDKDGDMDYVAGNLGLNTRYKVTRDQPMKIMAKDFDNNGFIDPVSTYYIQGKNYPIYHRNLMIDQMPYLHSKYKFYEDYALATINDMFSEAQIEGAYLAKSNYFETSYIENLGDGKFKIHALPIEAQFAPIFGLLANDYNNDGNLDILLIGNSYSSNVADGQFDASIGLLLAGDGIGGFASVPGRESGFFVEKDAKAMAELTMKDGRLLILASQNSGELKVFSSNKVLKNFIHLNSNDVSADVTYNSGMVERREFYYGSGYLSHSSRVIRFSKNALSVTITTYKGKSRDINLQ